MFPFFTISLRPKSILEILVVGVVVAFLGWLATDHIRNEMARRQGEADARADLALGKLTYRLRGLARPWHPDAIAIAAAEHGIFVSRTGGCVCTGPACSYDSAYNAVVVEHLRRTLGFDPISKSMERARSNWEKRHIAAGEAAA